MAFFRNRTVNILNLHTAISMIALTGGGAFFAVYLLKAGVSVPGVLLAMAAIFVGRFAIRSLLIFLAVRTHLRLLVIIGAVALAVQFPIVAEVQGVGPALFWMVFVSAVGDTIYWPSYHAFYAALGDAEHRGHQLGIREALSAVVGIVSPLVAGWLLVTMGPRTAFGATALIQVLSAVPLFWTPDVDVPKSVPGAFRYALPGIVLFIADGWTSAGFVGAWQVALFVTLGQDFIAYGGALAIAALVGAVSGIVLGRYIDKGRGAQAVWLSVGVFSFVVVLRAMSLSNPTLAVVANALGALSSCLYIPTLMTAVYNQAKRAPCTLRFHIMAEAGWDIGAAMGLFGAAFIAWSGYPLSLAILSALLGGIAILVLLQRYYAAHPTEVVEAALDAAEFEVKPGGA